MPRAIKTQRGIFERPKGSGIWWICYAGNDGRLHREKVGMRQAAIHVYQLRKTQIRLGKFAPVMRGVDLYTVKELLGHQSIEMTQRYAHLAPGHLHKPVEVLGEVKTQLASTRSRIKEEHRNRENSYVVERNGRPGGSRTPDQRFRKPLLYPSELQAPRNFWT